MTSSSYATATNSSATPLPSIDTPPESNVGDSAGQSSSSEVEDYDTLESRHATSTNEASTPGLQAPFPPGKIIMERSDSESSSIGKPRAYKPIRSGTARSQSPRRKSIQVVLQQTGRKGRYVLTADDSEIRDIVRRGLARQLNESQSGQKDRSRLRDIVFTRQFTTFDRQNPLSSQSPFQGFFTLFWLAIALLLINIAAQNWRSYGTIFGSSEILHMMVERDLLVLGITEGVMTAGTLFGVGLQKLIANGYLNWDRTGWIIQSLWEMLYLGAVIEWTFYREWPWTHTIFVVLHVMVFVMKQHSYAFYNGFLSRIYRRKNLLEDKLKQLDEADIKASSSIHDSAVATSVDQPTHSTQLQQRHSSATSKEQDSSTENLEIESVASAIDSGEPFDEAQVSVFSEILKSQIAALDEELHGKSTASKNQYPNNLTLANWADWTCLPTLVYELEYPRQDKINWWYVAEKTAAVFGVIWVMIVVSQAYIYPSVARVNAMKEAGIPLSERWLEIPWILLEILFPLLLEQLLSWYVIWECILNVLAELTGFEDRGFYGDWWNSVSFDYYARNWNVPVHKFLLRHVYHSSISSFKLSRSAATFVTFLLSAVIHELVMFCLFHKVRGYLFVMQLFQLPLAALSRTKLMKGRNVLGNLIFWLGLFVGPSLLTSLYLIV